MGTFEKDLYVPDVLNGTFGRGPRRQPGDSLDDHNLRKKVREAVMEQGSKNPMACRDQMPPPWDQEPKRRQRSFSTRQRQSLSWCSCTADVEALLLTEPFCLNQESGSLPPPRIRDHMLQKRTQGEIPRKKIAGRLPLLENKNKLPQKSPPSRNFMNQGISSSGNNGFTPSTEFSLFSTQPETEVF